MIGNNKFFVLRRDSPVLHTAHEQHQMWALHNNRELICTIDGLETRLQGVAPLWEWFGAEDLVMALRHLPNPLEAYIDVLCRVRNPKRRDRVYLYSDRGPVVASMDHRDLNLRLLKSEYSVLTQHPDLEELVTYFLTTPNFGDMSMEHRLQFMSGLHQLAIRSSNDGTGTYGIAMHMDNLAGTFGLTSGYGNLDHYAMRSIVHTIRRIYRDIAAHEQAGAEPVRNRY